jgi:hypothetical protein
VVFLTKTRRKTLAKAQLREGYLEKYPTSTQYCKNHQKKKGSALHGILAQNKGVNEKM